MSPRQVDHRLGPFSPELLADSARAHGTPLYVYDLSTVRAALTRLQSEPAFTRVRYAQKANGNGAILRVLREGGAAIDAVSAGEVHRALAAGFAPRDIVVTSDGLDRPLRIAVAQHRLHVNAGSLDALEQAAAAGAPAVTLRINPGVGEGHHAGVTTGGAGSKHGLWFEDVPRAFAQAAALGLPVVGAHVHVGSGARFERRDQVIERLTPLVLAAPDSLRRVSCGGGLPLRDPESGDPFDLPGHAAAWGDAVARWSAARGRALELEVEPGRFLVAGCGVLLTEVVARQRTPEHKFVLVDAGFETLARPVLYGAHHPIEPVDAGRAAEPRSLQVVAGPLCESSDLLTVDAQGRPAPRALPDLQPGDLLALLDTGAYGASMASRYNARPRPAEVVVDGGKARLSAPRGDLDGLLLDARDLA